MDRIWGGGIFSTSSWRDQRRNLSEWWITLRVHFAKASYGSAALWGSLDGELEFSIIVGETGTLYASFVYGIWHITNKNIFMTVDAIFQNTHIALFSVNAFAEMCYEKSLDNSHFNIYHTNVVFVLCNLKQGETSLKWTLTGTTRTRQMAIE